MSSDSTAVIASITPPSHQLVLPSSPTTTSLIFHVHDGNDIDDVLLDRCAKLFSENYGIWGKNPSSLKGPKPGARVKMTGGKLRKQCVAVPDSTVLVVCYERGLGMTQLELVGHAFVTVWDYSSGRIGWVTQLVVSIGARRRYIATSLLQMLKKRPLFRNITAIGLVSSHPSACHALSKYTSFNIHQIDLTFCQQNANIILEESPVEYVKTMELRGSLFQDECTTGAVCSVFTNFYVDHDEPLEALAAYKAHGSWILGELLEGHEYLIILPISQSVTPPGDVFQ